jgi:hypothetical protein
MPPIAARGQEEFLRRRRRQAGGFSLENARRELILPIAVH